MVQKSKYYLDKAAECLRNAETSPPHLKATLIGIAEQWTRLAEFAMRDDPLEALQEPRDVIREEDEEE